MGVPAPDLVEISLISFLALGTGFATFDLPPPLRTMSLAICMDLNPHPPNEWTSIEGPYELADYCLSKRTNVLILLDAWLDSGNEPDDKHDWDTLRYWSARLRPLWKSNEDTLVNSDDKDQQETLDKLDAQDAPGDEMIVIACNRCGEENGIPVSLDHTSQPINRL